MLNKKPFSQICCGQRYDFRTEKEREHKMMIHKKTVKHKMNKAVADEWVRAQTYFNEVIDSIMDGNPYCGRFPNRK